MTKYDRSGWLTAEAIRRGNQHRQISRDGSRDIRLRSKHGTQFRVEELSPKTEDVIHEYPFFSLAEARKRYTELVGQKPQKIFSPDADQNIIL